MLRLLLACLLPSLLFAQWQPTIIWERPGTLADAWYGLQVFALGDQNADGFADFGVSGYGNTSRVELFHGGNPPAPTPYMSFRWDSTGYRFYYGGSFGDVNGDGYTDWYVATETPFRTVRWEIYFGGPAADTLPDVILRTPRNPPAHEVRLRPLGDINGDGCDDIYSEDYMTDVAQVYFGGNPMDTLVDWTWLGHGSEPEAAMRGHGDLNGDGYSDWLSETWTPGIVYLWVFHGGVVPDTNVTYTIYGDNSGEDYLDAVAIVNDLNGDGRDELLATASQGLALGWGAERVHDDPDYFFADPCAGGGGSQVRSIGDFNHDGYNDFVKISETCSGWYWNGLCALWLGHPLPPQAPAVILDGDGPPLNVLGFSDAAGVGDVNGDGIDDLLLGSRQVNGMRGRAIIIAGDPLLQVGVEESRSPLPDKLEVTVFPNPFNSTTEIRYALPRASHVSLKVFNVTGREVAMLVDRVVAAGEQHVVWDASAVASGVYFVRLATAERAMTRKVLLVR